MFTVLVGLAEQDGQDDVRVSEDLVQLSVAQGQDCLSLVVASISFVLETACNNVTVIDVVHYWLGGFFK